MNRLAILLLALACLVSWAEADVPRNFTEQQLTFFETKIRPVRVEHSYECHAAGAKIVQGGLRVDHRAGLLRGGDSGPAVVPQQAEQSLLPKALRYDEFKMPPKGKLADSVIKDFEAWIAMGAPDPREAVADPLIRSIDFEEGRKHWAFQPVTDPQPPTVKHENWPLDPLDHFILARLEVAGLKPVAEANRHTWLRRVSLDQTGLPPTPGEIDAFINDKSPQAFEAVVDRLLSSRAFGERWARPGLDLTGYADMIGTSNNVFAEHAWRYRDYLIEATPWSQDLSGTAPIDTHGREHQPKSFCAWMAGGGIKGGFTWGETDHMGYSVVDGQIHIHDLHATMLHLLGIDHTQLTWNHFGRDFRLTDVHGSVVKEILA